ncbi:MAG: phenylalanine--tRNA ligase subunit beta [Candidatus Magasanikbacteria bacterium]|nr:phenylalanine--tRNA ligase subunit beta [Candidatus Magasanikbacteria bacterium]
MFISKEWLQDYVFLLESVSAEDLASKLTLSTVEVEGVEDKKFILDNIVVGEITKCSKHSDADKLKVCMVNVGGEEVLQIVCGGSNVKKGLKVVVAKSGSKVRWHGEGELVEIKDVKLRGVDSSGMICAADEIGLGELFPAKNEKEIMDVTSLNVAIGTPISEALKVGDVILDIDNKSLSNRPDLWGHYGMAREVAVLYKKQLSDYNPPEIPKIKENELNLKIKVKDINLCPRYMAVAVSGVSTIESPDWLKKRLVAIGVIPKNVLVDVTNYVMFDIGQPMHAFDADKLKNKEGEIEIYVKQAKGGEKAVFLDGEEREVNSGDLLITNKKNILALAGVIGGQSSAVSENTKNIVLESANFNASAIRKTSTKLNVRTESSSRFEKSVDPNLAEIALRRAVQLILEICPKSKVVSSVTDISKFKLNVGPIEFKKDFISKYAGFEIEEKSVVEILDSLGFEVKEKRNNFSVTIPTWRATKDVSIKEDLAEEVMRIYGYGAVEGKLPMFNIVPPVQSSLFKIKRILQDKMTLENGFTEVYNYSFVAPNSLKKLGLKTDKHIELDNPLAKDKPFLRRSLLTNLLENVEKNSHNEKSLALYEFGKTYILEESGARVQPNSGALLPRQDLLLSFALSEKDLDTPFYNVSSVLNSCLQELGVEYELQEGIKEGFEFIHPTRSAKVVVFGDVVGIIGEVHPAVQQKFGIPNRVAICELNLVKLLPFLREKEVSSSVSDYPAIERDIALVVEKSVLYKDLVEKMKNVDDLITSVELFDVFEGDKIGKTKKSMAYHIVYQSNTKTLKREDINSIHKELVKVLKKDFDADVRS